MNKVLLGLLTGIAVGILIAPTKGAVTRRKINDAFDEIADKLAALSDRFSAAATDEVEELSTEVAANSSR